MTPAARIFRFFCGVLCLGMFLLPIVAMIVHASAVQQAEREWERECQRMERTVKGARR